MRSCSPLVIALAMVSCVAEHSRSTEGGALTPMLAEELRIDGIAEDLVPIGMMLVTDDGTMALAQSQDARVRFFDESGVHLGSFGGSGEGPGEFRFITRIGLHHDTLWIFDSQVGRITLLTPGRELARTLRVPTQARPSSADSGRIPEFPFAIPSAMLPGGGFQAYLSPALNQDVPESFRNAIVYGVITETGVVERIITNVASHPNCCVQAEGSRGALTASVPFTNRSRYVPSVDGTLGVLATEPQGADGAMIAVTVFRMDGDTVFSRDYDVTRVPISSTFRDSVMRSRIEQLEQTSPALASAFREQATIPESYPPVADLVAGRDGTVWIEVPSGTADERSYLVIDSRGDAVGTLALPANSRISVAEMNRIWVLERDENDVQSVVRYRLDWSKS